MPFGHCRRAASDAGSCHHGHRRRHRRHGERGDEGTAWLRRQILGLVADRPLIGAAIIESLTAGGADDRLARPAAVYPMLRLLTETGVLVESTNPAGHAVYALDPECPDLPDAGITDGRRCGSGRRRRTRCADRPDSAPLSQEG